MEQYTENLYDDDLTVGVDEYDDFVQTDEIDLFEFYGEEESSISRLKTIVLSIDWEITDENLQDFSDELLVLKDEQLADKINLVYIQALEKIGKYIAKEKSNSNHNAVKLLQSFFYTLEKNISSGTVTDEERKKTLAEDVKKFEKLKQQISNTGKSRKKEAKADVPLTQEIPAAPADSPRIEVPEQDDDSPIRKLKAIVLGMDWEITDKELEDLGNEVKQLQGVFAGSKPKLIFLQGIDSIGAYIKKKKSNSHADAFKLLHSFCDKLDHITSTQLSLQEEKAILLPEVEKFNKFKEVVIATLDSEEDVDESDDAYDSYDELPPAFADVGEDVKGFQVDEEAAALQADELEVGEKIGSFFDDGSPEAEESAQEDDKKDTIDTINSFFDGEPEEDVDGDVDEDLLLQGVNVETEADDDSDEEPLPFTDSGELAPALSGDDLPEEGERDDQDGWEKTEEASEVFAKLDGFFGDDEELESEPEEEAAGISEEVLAGVDVETEADDDSDEAPLPTAESGEIAPALSGFDDEADEEAVTDSAIEAGIEESFDNLFGDDESFDTFKDAGEEPGLALEAEETEEKTEEEPALGSDDEEEEIALAFTDAAYDEESEDLSFDEGDEEAPALDEVTEEDDLVDSLADEVDAFFDETADDELADVLETPETQVVEEPADEVDELAPSSEQPDEIAFDQDVPDVIMEDVEEEEEVVFELAEEEPDSAEETAGEDSLAVQDFAEEILDDQFEADGFSAVFEAVEEDDVDAVSPIAEEVEATVTEPEEEEEALSTVFDDELHADVIEEDEQLEFDEIEEETEELLEPVDEIEEEAAAASHAGELPQEEEGEELAVEDDEDLEAYFKSTGLYAETDELANLRAGVSSIGVELDDSIIDSLLAEIQAAGQKFNDKPVGKIMLQLMFTVIQHINQYRYEASSDAHSLLLTIFDKLEMIDRGDVDDKQAQEMLLEETSKVLTWQQTMLDRQAVVKGDVLTFMDPIRSETGSEKAGEFVFTKLDIIDEGDLEEDTVDAPDDNAEEPEAVDVQEEPAVVEQGSVPPEDISALIKEEMKALRASLQEEINNLKKEFGNK